MPTDQFSVEGDTAIVTGASRGIGRTIAERFAADGADVAICSRAAERIDPVAEAITDSDRPGRAISVECDVRDREAVDRLMAETVDAFGRIDVLVNNAGGGFLAPFEEISENGWDAIVGINLDGTYHCTQAAGEYMRETGGIVINISSVNGQMAAPEESAYGASKAALINLTKTLAVEWAEYGIRVNCVAPGLVLTPGIMEMRDLDPEDAPDREETDRRAGLPEEIADVVQFLASPASSFMTGETVTAKGIPYDTDIGGRAE